MIGLNTCTNKRHFCNTEEMFDSCLIKWICLILLSLLWIDLHGKKIQNIMSQTYQEIHLILTYDVDIYGFHK